MDSEIIPFLTTLNSSLTEYKCPIDNALHQSEHGCFISNEESTIRHVYRRQKVSRNQEGKIIPDLFDFNTNYIKKYYEDGALVWETELSDNFFGFEIFDTGEKLYAFFKHVLISYFSSIHPTLGGKFISPKHLFDIVFVKDSQLKIIHLRPVLLASSQHEFICDLRRVFFELFDLFCKDAQLEGNTEFKEKQMCSIAAFAQGRAVPEFSCKASVIDHCPHIIQQVNEFGVFNPNIEGRICRFLLTELITIQHEFTPASKYGFKCRFLCDDERASNVKYLTQVFQDNKPAQSHRLCVPNLFLTSEWLIWFLSLFGVDSYYEQIVRDMEESQKESRIME